MDIFKIARIAPNTSLSQGDTIKSREGGDRDPQQGGNEYRREETPSAEDAQKAAEKLRGSPHFIANDLEVEVREQDARYFLDVFDPQHRKIKTIGGVGIRAILVSYNYESSRQSGILDRKI